MDDERSGEERAVQGRPFTADGNALVQRQVPSVLYRGVHSRLTETQYSERRSRRPLYRGVHSRLTETRTFIPMFPWALYRGVHSRLTETPLTLEVISGAAVQGRPFTADGNIYETFSASPQLYRGVHSRLTETQRIKSPRKQRLYRGVHSRLTETPSCKSESKRGCTGASIHG